MGISAGVQFRAVVASFMSYAVLLYSKQTSFIIRKQKLIN
jgi:sRNA-binding regulator protein Hfq